MKKLLALLLALISCFAFLGCQPVQPSGQESKNESDSTSENLVEMQEIQPSGTVNLAEELALFSKLLDNNYINADATVYHSGQEFYFKINARRTEKGYDAIVTRTVKGYDGVSKIYYVDGVEVRGNSLDGVNYDYIKTSEKHFVDLIGEINAMLNSSTETKLIYHVLKPLIHRFEGFEEVSHRKDYKDDYNNGVNLLKEYQYRSVYEFVLEQILGVDSTDEEAVNKVRADILDFCSGNPSVAVFIDRLEDYINTKREEENKIDIEAYLNDLQQRSGVTTQEFVDMVKTDIPAISDNLRAPENGESVYGYIRSYLKTISLNMFTKNVIGQDVTFVDFVDGLIESSKNITVEYAYNWIISNTIKKAQDGNGNVIIGDHLAAYLAQDIICQKLLTGFTVEVDGKGRPTLLKGEFECAMPPRAEEGEIDGLISSVTVKINYKKTDVKFVLPEEYESSNAQ